MDAKSRKHLRAFAIPLAVILGVTLIGLSLMRDRLFKQGDAIHPEGPQVGTVLQEDFSLQLEGQKSSVPLADILKPATPGGKKILLLNFWATWCGPCLIEIPSILKLRKDYQTKGLEVALVSLDDVPASVLPEAKKKLGIDFLTFVDPDGDVAQHFGVSGLPLSLLIDQDRKILHVELGERDWNARDIRHQLDTWLGDQAKR